MTLSEEEQLTSALVAALDGLEPVRCALKRASMVYQFSLKSDCAFDLGLNFSDVDLPYAQWSQLRSAWLEWKR